MLNTIKYFKKAYVMSVASYEFENWPSGVPDNKTENFKNLTTFDELTQELLKTQEELLKNPNDKESLAKINQIIEERTAEEERIKSLYNPELVKQFTSEQLKKYANDLNQFQNIRIARQEAQKRQQEKITAIQKPIKEFTKDMLTKAEIMVNYSKNPDFKNKWFDLKIEDWKIALYNPEGKRLKYFSIPTMNTDWSINNKENLKRLENPLVWFEDFVKKYVPEVKTYAEIWADNIKKYNKEQKIASIQKESKKYNENLIDFTKKGIEWLEANFNLPDWTDLLLDWDKVVLNLPDWKKHYFTLNMKNVSWKETHPENKWKNIYWLLKQWVEKYTWKLKTKES